MPSKIPSIDELKDNSLLHFQKMLNDLEGASDFKTAFDPPSVNLNRSNNRVIAFMQAVGLHGVYLWLRDKVLPNAVPGTATGNSLIGWLETYGMSLKPATLARGKVVFSGLNGSVVKVGTELQDDAGHYFIVLSEGAVAASSVTLDVESVIPGLSSNLAAGTKLSLVQPVAGVNAEVLVSSAGLTAGVDKETDIEASRRLIHRLSNPPMGGSPTDYERWALELPGITRAWGIRAINGPCTVGVLVMADANIGTNGLPNASQLATVKSYILARCPPVVLTVEAPAVKLVNFTITLNPSTDSAKAAVKRELSDLFLREAMPGQGMPHSHINEAISVAPGENDHAVTSPTLSQGGVISAGSNEILALGSVGFN